jgi:hypothetical protein
MDPAQVLEELGVRGKLPVEAIRAAQADRATMVPLFLRRIDDFLSLEGELVPPAALFFMFHLLGEWREKSAYRPLADLLRLPRDGLDPILGAAITETTHRVMAAVFDGDPGPLYEIIRDAQDPLPDVPNDRDADPARRVAARRDRGLPARLLLAARCVGWLLRLARLARCRRLARISRTKTAGAAGVSARLHRSDVAYTRRLRTGLAARGRISGSRAASPRWRSHAVRRYDHGNVGLVSLHEEGAERRQIGTEAADVARVAPSRSPAQSRAQRSLSVRQRKEIQKMLLECGFRVLCRRSSLRAWRSAPSSPLAPFEGAANEGAANTIASGIWLIMAR